MSGFDTPEPPPRLAPQMKFPPYSYVTGRFPHPTRDPAGHSHAHRPVKPPPIVAAQWSASRDYLWGCDLFNYGYYWEAHEVWEGLWHAGGRGGATADFLKGLIKLAAAGVKVRENRTMGVRRHAARAIELFTRVRERISDARYLGLNIDWLIEAAGRLERNPPSPSATDAPVEVVFNFQLLPQSDRN
jgi:hypothetical protein